MSDDVDRAMANIRATFETCARDVERRMRQTHEEERRKLSHRAERVEKRYDALANLAEQIRDDMRRIEREEFDDANTEERRERIRGHLDGLRAALDRITAII